VVRLSAAVLVLVLAASGCALLDAGRTTALDDGLPIDGRVADAPADARVDANLCGHCAGDVVTGCEGQPDTTCTLGCSDAGGAHCKELVPSNGVPLTSLSAVTAGLTTLSAATTGSRHEYTIDTDTGEILDYGDDGFPNSASTTIRAAGSGTNAGMAFTIAGTVAVLGVDSVHIADNSVLYGFGSHSLVVLSRNDVLIEGAIDLSGGCYDALHVFERTCAGPGGGGGATASAGADGCGPGANGLTSKFTGGGGGGFATSGAPGGDYSPGNRGGAGGVATACADASLVPLQGGGGGGHGGGTSGGAGGGGGGALQITSLGTITISHPAAATAAAEISVAGAGGQGPPTVAAGGGGGGAGGAILLEARVIAVHATLAANGGGGGGGRIVGASADGNAGTTTTQQAQGGAGDGVNGDTGRGGLGGAALGAPSPGTLAGTEGTGGGGGATGRVRLNTLTGAVDLANATISPGAAIGTLVAQ
jgi:hypothetical protein